MARTYCQIVHAHRLKKCGRKATKRITVSLRDGTIAVLHVCNDHFKRATA